MERRGAGCRGCSCCHRLDPPARHGPSRRPDWPPRRGAPTPPRGGWSPGPRRPSPCTIEPARYSWKVCLTSRCDLPMVSSCASLSCLPVRPGPGSRSAEGCSTRSFPRRARKVQRDRSIRLCGLSMTSFRGRLRSIPLVDRSAARNSAFRCLAIEPSSGLLGYTPRRAQPEGAADASRSPNARSRSRRSPRVSPKTTTST